MRENTWLLNAHLYQTFLGPPWTWLSCPTLFSRPVFIFSHFGTNENFHLTTFFKVCPTCFWPRPPRPSPPPRFPSFSYSFLLTWFHFIQLDFIFTWVLSRSILSDMKRCTPDVLRPYSPGVGVLLVRIRLLVSIVSIAPRRHPPSLGGLSMLSCSNAQQGAGGLWLDEWLSHILGTGWL